MKNLPKLMFSLLVLTLFTNTSFATEETSLSQLVPEVKAAEIESLDEYEQERKKSFEEQLGFTIPEYTDNPSYVITFVDPSPSSGGVQLEIDNDKYVDITSPYTFPALSIGQHHLSFRFTDKDDAVQELEYDVSILPRPPIIKTPVFDESKISLSGTGLAGSEVILFLTSNTNSYPQIVDVDTEGNWAVDVEPKSDSANGVYTVVGYTRKYGYASDLSQPVVFQVGNDTAQVVETTEDDIYFSFASINTENVGDIVSKNSDLLILVGGVFLLGILLALLLRSLIIGGHVEKSFKHAEQSIKSVGTPKEKTLKELFEEQSSGKGDKKEKAKEVVVEEKKEEKENVKKDEKIISKKEFLKKFKMLDPDDNKGKEKASTETKKEIKVSLTSHEEE